MAQKTMKMGLFKEICALARSKSLWTEKVRYFILGIVYLPFLSRDLSVSSAKSQSSEGIDPQFDDIYPLF